MKISIAADHAGYELKQALIGFLQNLGHVVQDLGTHSTAPVDYPDYAEAVALAVRNKEADRGVLICGSGVGASVAANKVPGIRAGLCHDSYSAHQGVEHDNMNVLVFGSRVIGPELAKDLAAIYLKANFTGEERHVRRLAKVQAMEVRYGNAAKSGA
ncbi:MAG: ribose 5-phosphate isomerase B [Candidatus Acidiferrales bacterium]